MQLVRLRDGWSAIPIEEDGCARSRRITREQQLAAAPLQPGGTAYLDRWHLAHCPPRLHRWCAAAAALANTSTWAAPLPPHRLYSRPKGPEPALTVKEVTGGDRSGTAAADAGVATKTYVAKSFTVNVRCPGP